MVLFYLTTSTLDVILGITWWVTKNTCKGIYYSTYYVLYGNNYQTVYNKNDLIEEITKLQKQIEYIK